MSSSSSPSSAIDRASVATRKGITATGFGVRIQKSVTINVLTGEFVQDVAGSLQSEVLRYVPGVITNPNYESYIEASEASPDLQSYRNGQYRRRSSTPRGAWTGSR